jgi:16S rRNA (guanine527-N7)-methyltransferase
VTENDAPQIGSEEDARAWIATLGGVSRETFVLLDQFAALLRAANSSQNLVAASTLAEALWVRHIADSAQLVPLAQGTPGPWADLGSGAGLPGLIIAIIDRARPVTLIESRPLRARFLREAAEALGLTERVHVVEARVERVDRVIHAVISARAFAPLATLIPVARHLAGPETLWLLPKGQNGVNELSTIAPSWQGLFHVEHSLTHPQSAILVGRGRFSGGDRQNSEGRA